MFYVIPIMPCTVCGEEGHNARTCPVGNEYAQTAAHGASDLQMDDESDKLTRLWAMKRTMNTPTKSEAEPAGKSQRSDGQPEKAADDAAVQFCLSTPKRNVSSSSAGLGHQSPPQGPDPQLLQALAGLLDLKLATMQSDIATIKENALSKEELQDLIAPLQRDMASLSLRVATLEKGQPVQQEVLDRIEEIEQKIQMMKVAGSHDKTAVVGGMGDTQSFDEAEAWIQAAIKKRSGPTPTSVYFKGDEFRGIVFADFATKDDRDGAVNIVKSLKDHINGQKVWADAAEPIDIRTMKSFLFALKKQMVAWEYGEKEVWVDKVAGTMSIAGKPVLKVAVMGASMKLTWCDDEWASWDLLQQAPELGELIKGAELKLQKGSGGGKGKNSGKKGQNTGGPQ